MTLPTIDHISEFLKANIALLSESHDVSPEELLEARDLLEGRAARAAAERRTEAHLRRLRDCIIDDHAKLGTEEQFTFNTAFHTGVLDAAQNTLLAIAAQPVFGVLQRNMRRSEISRETLHQVNDQHRAIVDAIDAATRTRPSVRCAATWTSCEARTCGCGRTMDTGTEAEGADRGHDPAQAATDLSTEVLRGPGEIAEDDAGGALAQTYTQLRAALGVTFVPTVFRMLARHERYLTAAVTALAPAVATRAAVVPRRRFVAPGRSSPRRRARAG